MFTDWGVTLEDLRADWDDAPLDDAALSELANAAWVQCATYAPTLPVGVPVPDNFRLALKMQTRSLWQQMAGSSQDSVGGAEFSVTVFPMDWSVQQLLRPKRGVPRIR